MDISQAIAELKKTPGFSENVGMILVHNGVIRGWSRKDHRNVSAVEITPDHAKIQALCDEFQKRPGIFRAIAQAEGGVKHPGDDVLFIIVAGDIRENVKSALSDLLDRIKSEAVAKREIFG
ncbi:MAG: molybdenum cofactor biosynthesis protein MoaE [Humidesulfovibrio sp.]|jgi:molybdopterin synthase catalytic subunit|nr:molybdenum cofactor biosynthesis protein MoaE [Humidesulfovibrio sp.]PKN09213.1 MAG: molybdenum cofactor biosynthesis protein [Deltaproteobacteria bacterium HGW-Deltaproteobacteria-8]